MRSCGVIAFEAGEKVVAMTGKSFHRQRSALAKAAAELIRREGFAFPQALPSAI
jgi:hypothetical protein